MNRFRKTLSWRLFALFPAYTVVRALPFPAVSWDFVFAKAKRDRLGDGIFAVAMTSPALDIRLWMIMIMPNLEWVIICAAGKCRLGVLIVVLPLAIVMRCAPTRCVIRLFVVFAGALLRRWNDRLYRAIEPALTLFRLRQEMARGRWMV